MKKEFTNADVITIYDVLKELGSRGDVVCGDADIYWANCINTTTFEEKATQARKIIEDIVSKHFTDENSHEDTDENGTPVRILNDDVKDKVVRELNDDINKIYNKKLKLEIETFSEAALKKMVKANEDKLSYLTIKVLREFIEKDDE